MCDYMYDMPRKYKARKIAEPEPELEKVEEKPMVVKT
jgi:hypothetical protein